MISVRRIKLKRLSWVNNKKIQNSNLLSINSIFYFILVCYPRMQFKERQRVSHQYRRARLPRVSMETRKLSQIMAASLLCSQIWLFVLLRGDGRPVCYWRVQTPQLHHFRTRIERFGKTRHPGCSAWTENAHLLFLRGKRD